MTFPDVDLQSIDREPFFFNPGHHGNGISNAPDIRSHPFFTHGLRNSSFKIPLNRPIFAVIHNQA